MDLVVLRAPLLLVALFAVATSPALAREELRTEKVDFKRGATRASLNGKIKGYEGIDYILEASKGQQMNVSMATDNAANYFNILATHENEQAMFVGSTSGNQFEDIFPKSDAYKIRVYMMRSAAHRKEVAKHQLEMIISGASQKTGLSSDAKAGAAKSGMPSKDEQACVQAVSHEANNGDVVTLSVETSEANSIVMVGVGPNRAPWKCLASGGVIAEVMSMKDEGAL